MAEEKKILYLEGLQAYHKKNKAYINSKTADAFRYAELSDNSAKFYTTNPKGENDVPVFTLDFPADLVLDQAKTTFVGDFIWSEESYPGSTNPNLNGEPVLVLGVKGGDSVTYSFLNMKKLVDIYTGGETSTATATVSADNVITINIKVSAEEGNALQIKDDGLFVPTAEATDISGKTDKLTGDKILTDQILVDDGTGNLKNSGKTVKDITDAITAVSTDLANFTAITNEEIDALFV